MNERIRTIRTERGAAAVEFALIASLLAVIVFGIFEFGRVFSQYEVLQGAAREGARVAAVRAPAGDVVARVRQAAGPIALSSAPSVSRTCDDASVGQPVTVSWTQRFRIGIPFVPVMHKTVLIKGVFRCE